MNQIETCSLIIFILLKYASDGEIEMIQKIFNRLENVDVNGKSIINSILKKLFNTMTRFNKDKMIYNVSLIYNCAPDNEKIDMQRQNIWPILNEQETELFDIPKYSVDDEQIMKISDYEDIIIPKYEKMDENCLKMIDDEIKSKLRNKKKFTMIII